MSSRKSQRTGDTRLNYKKLHNKGERSNLHEDNYCQHRSSTTVDSSSDTDTFESVPSDIASDSNIDLNQDQDQDEEDDVEEITLLLDAFGSVEDCSSTSEVAIMESELKP